MAAQRGIATAQVTRIRGKVVVLLVCAFAGHAMASADSPALPPRLAKFDRPFKPGDIDPRCRIFLTTSRITQRHAGRRGHPSFKPSDLTVTSLFRRIVKLRKFRLKIDGQELAKEWMKYDIDRPVDHPLVPILKIKRNRHLHKRLNHMFHRRFSASETRRFVYFLKFNDFELHEHALERMAKNDAERAARAKNFDIHKVIREWKRRKNDDPTSFWPSYHHGGFALALQLGVVMQGDLSDEMTADFLIELQKADETLYLTFALRLLEETRGDAVETSDNDRWLAALDRLYDTWDMDRFLPPYETHFKLRMSLEHYFLPNHSGFVNHLQNMSPLAAAWRAQVVPERDEDPIDDEEIRTLTRSNRYPVRETIHRWAVFMMGEAFRGVLVNHKEDLPLHMFFRRIFAYNESEPQLKSFMAEVKVRNPFVHAYLATARALLEGTDGTPGMLRAAGVAYRWIDYFENKSKDGPLMPPQKSFGPLYSSLLSLKNGTVKPEHFKIFRKVIEANSPELTQEIESWGPRTVTRSPELPRSGTRQSSLLREDRFRIPH